MRPLTALCLWFACSCGSATAQSPARPRLIYQGGPDVDYLRIEKLPDPHIVPIPARPVTIKTRKGDVKLYRVLSGNCSDLFSRLLTTPRVSVEVKDDSYYSKNIKFTEPYSLPGLGLSVEYRQVEIDVIVVRERKPRGAGQHLPAPNSE